MPKTRLPGAASSDLPIVGRADSISFGDRVDGDQCFRDTPPDRGSQQHVPLDVMLMRRGLFRPRWEWRTLTLRQGRAAVKDWTGRPLLSFGEAERDVWRLEAGLAPQPGARVAFTSFGRRGSVDQGFGSTRIWVDTDSRVVQPRPDGVNAPAREVLILTP